MLVARRAALACLAAVAVACGASPTAPSAQARPPRPVECAKPAPDDFYLVGDDPAARAPITNGTEIRFVHYDGETMQILTACTAEKQPPSIGAYSCSTFMEPFDGKVDVDEGHVLCEKFPLAIGTIGSRFASGAALHAHVAVTAVCTATRPIVHGAEIAHIPGCEAATHFIYSYDLGALSLAMDDEAMPSESRGDFSTCDEISARKLQTCKAPIRVALRAIQAGGTPAELPRDGDGQSDGR